MIPDSSQKSKYAWLAALGIIFLAVAASLAVWWPYVFAGKAMWHDWARVAQNMFQLAHEQLHQLHKFPTWTDSYFSGFPFTRSLNGLYNPVNILLIWLSNDAYTAFHWVMVMNFILGFLAAYAFGRLISLSRTASIILAFGFTYTQWNIDWAHNNLYSNLILIPPLLFGAVYASRKGFSWLWTLLAIYAITTGFTSATPDSAAWAVIFGGVFALYLDWKEVGRPRRLADIWRYKATLIFGIIFAASVLVSLFFLLPSLQLASLTYRNNGLSLQEAANGSLYFGDLILLFFPYFPNLPYILHNEPHIYFGIVTLFCSILGLAVRKSRSIGSIFTIMLIYIILANIQYSPLYGVALLIPGLNTMRGQFRMLFVGYFFLATLAGIGIDALQKGEISETLKRKLGTISRSVLAVVGIGWIAMLVALQTRLGQYTQDMGLRLFRHIRGNQKPLEHYQFVWSGFTKQIGNVVSLGDMRFVATLGVIFALWFILRRWGRGQLTSSRAAIALAVLSGLNMVFVFQHYHVEVPRELVTERSAAIRFLDGIKPKEPFRIFTASSEGLSPAERLDNGELRYAYEPYMRLANEALIPNANILFGYQSIGGNEGIRPRRINELLSSFVSSYASNPGETFGFNLISKGIRSKLLTKYRETLSMMNVRYIITTYELELPWKRLYESYLPDTDTTVRIYENTDVLPRAYFPRQVEFLPINEVATLPRILANKNFAKTSFIECRACSTESVITSTSEARVVIVDYNDSGHLVLRTQTQEPRWLIVSENNLSGWVITIDGKKTESQLANYQFHGVLVPGGTHVVDMEFPGLWSQFMQSLRHYLFDPFRKLEKDDPQWPHPEIFS